VRIQVLQAQIEPEKKYAAANNSKKNTRKKIKACFSKEIYGLIQFIYTLSKHIFHIMYVVIYKFSTVA